MLERETFENVVTLRLNDPLKRNALSVAMFDALDKALSEIERDEKARVVLLTGAGSTFCAGFDLKAALDDPHVVATLIDRLSRFNRRLRRLQQITIAAVHGAAIAGGCAIVSACDLTVVSRDAKLGYPVHQLGISPAVTIPTLSQAVGSAAARGLLMSGELIDGERAHAIGLATHLARSCASVVDEAIAMAREMAAKPPNALRTTKALLNQLDGSLDEARFDGPVQGSASLVEGENAQTMLLALRSRFGDS